MSSPRTDSLPTDKPTEKPKAAFNPVQVAAGALAAVSSAVLLSFFGVAGTLIGAALASIVSSVGASLYSTSLSKTNARLRKALTGRQKPAPAAATAQDPAPRGLPAHLDPRRAPATRFRPRWSRVAVYAVAVFVVAMGVITGIELISQKPVSALVTSSHTSGTTLGELTGSSSHQDTTPSTPSPPSTPPSTPPTTAPATSTADNSPAEPTRSSSSASESAAPSTTRSSSESSSSSSASSAPRSSAAPTGSQSANSEPAQGAAPTP